MLSFIKNLFSSKPTQLEVEVKAEVPYKVEALPAGTEAANITAVYIAPEAAATTPIPLVVAVPAEPAKKPAKAKATPKPKAAPKPKAPAKPRAPKAPK
jgi:hypothetical protein